jgi:uncharacterized membrane protein YphA (DoxX/SURF4 family)
MKLIRPREELVRTMGAWVEDFSDNQVKGIGLLEIAAAVGLIVPAALDILPILTPLAAAGIVLLMIGAARVHIRRRDYGELRPNIIIGLLALAVAVLRFGPYSL